MNYWDCVGYYNFTNTRSGKFGVLALEYAGNFDVRKEQDEGASL